MRLTLFLFLLFSTAYGQTNFVITKIPYANTEVRDYGRGAEDWQFAESQIVDIPTEGAPVQPKNLYKRYKWFDLETTQGNYDFTKLTNDIRYCIDRKMKFGFGVMHQYVGDEQGGYPTADGAGMTYPLYLHTLMAALPANEKDWITYNQTPWWTPNYNAPIYLERFDSLNAAIYRYLETSSYQGVKYKDVIQYVDIRGYGNWGEWNQVGVANYVPDDFPTGRQATYETLKRIVQSYTTYYPDIHLAIMYAVFDCERLGNIWNPPAIARYAIDTAANLKGKVGWRRDNFGSQDEYNNIYLQDNVATSIRDTTINFFIMNRYKTAYVINEHTSEWQATISGGVVYGTLESQVSQYNVASFGIGNYYAGPLSLASKNAFRAASKRAGHRIVVNSGSMATAITSGVPFNITLNWGNEGVAPTYDAWKVRYQLRNTTTNAVVWTGNSTVNLRNLMPSTNATSSESFTVSGVAPGNYRVHLIVEDSVNYMLPLNVMISGRQSDGSYILRSSVSLTSTGNIPPVSDAGANQAITLPVDSVTLSGSATDVDGTIASYAWTKVSGTGGTIVSTTSASTKVTGLTAGVYVFRLTATDNQGATGSDDIQITVNADAPANVSPVAVAGTDQFIVLPTSTATLTGSATDADGTIASYAWTRTYGPTATIASPTSATTNITGMTVSGIYGFRLTVTDNLGATDFDDIDIYVDPAPNVLPVPNAGTDQTITLPTSQVTLTGSATDADGVVTTYLWTKVSGPAGQIISPTNTASTLITGLTQGTYVFRLRVTDNDGGQAFDDITITVNPEPTPPEPGFWIFDFNPNPEIISDGTPITLGMKFRASQAGAIVRMRFWKNAGNTGTHTGGIWSSDGTLLTTGTFTNETPQGWQYLTLPDTVFVEAGVTYVVGYYCPTGIYSQTTNGLIGNITNGPLTAPANDLVGGNGVSEFGGALAFPNDVYFAENYWIDVEWVDATQVETPNLPPTVSAGLDVVIKAPVSSYQVTAVAADSDGTIASYDWAQIGGVAATISDTAIANPTISGMTTGGNYTFLVTVTDNDGATATDIIIISVNTATSQWQKRRTFLLNGRRIYFRR